MISGNAYEEVYEILSCMDKLTVMKIPEDILQDIKTKRNLNFKTRIDKFDIFNEQNISEETVDFLCWLDYQYWMSEEKKLRINKISRDIMIKNENEKREKYNYKNINK